MCNAWMGPSSWTLILALVVCCETGAVGVCPEECVCKKCFDAGGAPDATSDECKLVCKSKSPSSSLTLVPQGIPPHARQIDLSGNTLTHITRADFQGLVSLEKLDLSSNQIKAIEPRAFAGLQNLVKLDLSGNGLKSVNASLFQGLPNLERLELAGNELESVPEGTFDVLPLLKKVDFKSRSLRCDCRLQWVVRWQKEKNVRIRESTKCQEPEEHRNKSLRDLKKKEFICDEQVDLPYFQLLPSSSQVVFEGDRLPFECRASIPDISAHMMWVRGVERVVANQSQGILIRQTISPDHSMVMQSLVLERLQKSHSGVWKCFIQTSRGNASKSVNIVVMSLETVYCPAVTKITSKGTFRWPKTVSGVTTSLPCMKGAAASYLGDAVPTATYRCAVEAEWEDLDDTQCAYTSEVTRMLEQYSRELTNTSNVLTYMDILVSRLTNKMDIVYIAQILETLGKQVKDNEQVADFLLNTASSLMNVDVEILKAAQREDGSCAKIIKVLDALPKELLWDGKVVNKRANNIALQAYAITSKEFDGMTCDSWRFKNAADPKKNVYIENTFLCREGSNDTAEDPPNEGMELESSIHIPADIFKSVRCLYPQCTETGSYHLQFIVYKNAKLFPVVSAHPNRLHLAKQVPNVITSVISSKFAGASVENTTSPIVTKLRMPSGTSSAKHKAVYWDFMANDGRGSWLTHGCSLAGENEGLATVHCNHLTHFGISEDTVLIQAPYDTQESLHSWIGGLFTMSPPVYGGGVILVLCTMTVLITYISGHRYILMPRKGKHAVGNICLCLLLLCLTFSLGVHISEPIIACRVVGVAIHYFSLAALFWIVILTFMMYKKFVKLLQPPPPPVDPLEEPPPPRSAVTCYLIGWGISVIICGISGAINWQKYAGHSNYCFLTLNAAVLTFFAPAGLIVTVNLALILRIWCVLRNGKQRAPPGDEPETEEIQVHEANDADGVAEDLLTTVAAAGTTIGDHDGHSRAATPTKLDRSELTSSMVDLEHRPVNQLRGVSLLLMLYLISWCCAALAIAHPFSDAIPHQEIIFNYLYGFSTFGLGVYILAFYCVSRRDCREAWRYCCNKPSRHEDKLDDIPPPMTLQQLNHIRTNGHVQSATSLSSTHTNKSNTISSFNPPLYSIQKPSQVNLVPSQTSEPSFTSLQDFPIFYNPRQNGIAKKYWEKKHHRNVLRHMSREMNDSGHSSNTEGRGGIIYDGGRRLSNQGNSSDGNTNRSLEIQIPGRNGILLDPRLGGHSPVNPEQLQNLYNSLSRRRQMLQQQVHHQQGAQTMTIDPVTGAPMMVTPLDRHHMPPVAGRISPTVHIHSVSPVPPSLTSHSPLPPLLESSNFIPGQSGSSSAANMPISAPLFNPNQYLLGMAPYPCDTSRYTPIDHDPCNTQRHMFNEYMQRNGSVPRLRDFDGQSQVSQPHTAHTEGSCKSPHILGPAASEASYKSSNVFGPSVSESLRQSPGQITITDAHPKANGTIPGLHKDKLLLDKNVERAVESESEVLSDTDPFIKEIKQRIPPSSTPIKQEKSPVPLCNGTTPISNSDTSSKSKSPSPFRDVNGGLSSDGGVVCNSRPVSGESHDGRGSGGDSSSNSKTSCTRSEPMPHGRPHQGSYQRSKSLPKGGQEWDDTPRKDSNHRKKPPCYAFVNHKYQDKVLQKLIKQNQASGSSLVDSGVSWLPRSVSAYDQVVTTETDTLVEEESANSSTDDSDDDIWILSNGHKKKQLSQETSV